MDFWEMINDPITLKEKKNDELTILKNHVLQDNICWLYLKHDLELFNNIIKSIYSIKGFNQFIKTIDQLNGCIGINETNSPININLIYQIITNNFSKQFNITKFNVDISKFIFS
jgi:hypothetical protein